jgi:hypothetical protein
VQVGDLVKNLNSESGLLGVIVGWVPTKSWGDVFGEKESPLVCWQDGRTGWIVTSRVRVINESR